MKTERGAQEEGSGAPAGQGKGSVLQPRLQGGPVGRQLPLKDKGSDPSEEKSSTEINRAA